MKMKSVILTLTSLFCAMVLPGCTSMRLQHSITSQATTIADLHYQQVLNNLAMYSVSPNSLPSQVQIKEGSAQVQDFGQLNLAAAVGHSMGSLATGSPNLTGSRTVVEQWGVSPVTDDVELRVLTIAYQRAVGLPSMPDLELLNDIARGVSQQTSETGDIDQRSDDISTNTFRSKFAELNAASTFAKIANQPSGKKIDLYRDSITFNKLIDFEGLEDVVSTNSDRIILEEEFLVDSSLRSMNPVYSRGPRGLIFFTPLAKTARREVKEAVCRPGRYQAGLVPHRLETRCAPRCRVHRPVQGPICLGVPGWDRGPVEIHPGRDQVLRPDQGTDGPDRAGRPEIYPFGRPLTMLPRPRERRIRGQEEEANSPA